MIIWSFAVHLNRSLVELVGLVIEKTEVAYLKSFPCVVVKKTFQVTCGVASFQLFCRVPASSRRQKISMILQFTPLIDEISVLGGVVIPTVDIEHLKVGLLASRRLAGRVIVHMVVKGPFIPATRC